MKSELAVKPECAAVDRFVVAQSDLIRIDGENGRSEKLPIELQQPREAPCRFPLAKRGKDVEADFDSFAEDIVLQITGRRKFQDWNPSELLVSWLVFPKEWDKREFILITRKDVKRQLGLNEDFVHEGILGTVFTGRLVEETTVGEYRAVVPALTGQAWITGFNTLVVDPDDPFQDGFTVGDIW